MFTNLIESDSHRRELKRQSSFFLATVAAYALILFAAGIASIYAYDARLEAQSTDLLIDYWVPPVPTTQPQPPQATRPQPPRRSTATNAPVDRSIRIPTRTEGIAQLNDPTKVPDHAGTQASRVLPVIGKFRQGTTNADPPTLPSDSGNCITCNSTQAARIETDTPAPPPTVKPQTQRLPPQVLVSKAISLPEPPYPPLAKQIRAQGPVPVQILVDENGRVLSAHAVSGNAFLTRAAEEAAMRARFTPTTLNGQPVKVQGVITYNFVLQ